MNSTDRTNQLPGSDGEHQAQESFGTRSRALAFYNMQMLEFLNPLMRDFVHAQEMVFLATADALGNPDSSVRFGPPGFVHVLDERTLIFPEYRGNGVMASVGNIIENPKIGLLFLDFVQSTIGLHINGRARIVEKAELLRYFVQGNSDAGEQDSLFERMELTADAIEPLLEATLTTGGRHPERWIAVEVEEAYIHCAKHVPKFVKLDKTIHWGTDDVRFKGGNAFKAKECVRPWVKVPDSPTSS